MNERYSYKDWTDIDLTGEPVADFDGEIIGACFTQQSPDTNVFPAGITTTFSRCALVNCVLPVGATEQEKDGIASAHYNVAEQNDNELWILDGEGKPTEPVNKDGFVTDGHSIDPADIPETKLDAPITLGGK